MSTLQARFRQRAEKGSVAIETALSLVLLSVFVIIPFLLARIFWYYSVAEKAAHDGARFLSNAAQYEIVTPSGSGSDEPPIVGLAEAIARAEMADIAPGLDWFAVKATCDLDECGGGAPQVVRVSVQMRIRNDILGPMAYRFFGEEPLRLEARVTMRYVGN